jgi:hypothetical protein
VSRALLAAVLVAAGLAGCLSSSPSPSTTHAAGLEPFVNPIGVGHDHADFSVHVLSNNVDLVGHSYLDPDGGNETPGGLGEIDVAGDYAYVAVFGHGFAVVDIHDPANPKLMSIVDTPTPGTPVGGKYTADLKVDASGDWVFLGMELSETPGVLIYDARDRANPKLAGFWPAPGTLLGCHMVEYAVINEQEYVFCAPLDNAIWVGLLLPPTPTGQREIQTVAHWVPTTPKFVQQQAGAVQSDPRGYGPSLVSGHQDMTYQLDPLTGKPMLFVSFWNLGMRIVDVSVPAAPLEIGSWAGEDGELWRGNLHTTVATAMDGKRIIVTIPEGTSPPALFVLDATDLDAPKLLAQWTALDDFQGEDGIFSLHNFQILYGHVYIAMGHGGVWDLDITDPTHPTPIASYLPHEPAADGKGYQGYYWDSVLWHGYWLTADGSGGFYVLHDRAMPAGDGNYTSFA